jgi:enoyl-CoA hydratase
VNSDVRRSGAIVTESIDTTTIVRFNQPAERNPLSTKTLHELDHLLAQIASNADVNAIIFTGTDDVFASGANIRELGRLDASSAREFSKLGQAVFQKIASSRQLTIAAVNGYCMGGALDLALACDLRLASTKASFAHPGAKLGIITGWGGTQRLPKLVGRARAFDLLLTAKRINSSEALSMGLVNEVGDPIVDRAVKFAREVLDGAP